MNSSDVVLSTSRSSSEKQEMEPQENNVPVAEVVVDVPNIKQEDLVMKQEDDEEIKM